jgi:aminopeptidase N
MIKGILIFILLFIGYLFAQQQDEDRIEELAKNREKVHQMEKESFAREFEALKRVKMPDSTDFDQIYYNLKFNITTAPQNLEATVYGLFRSNINGLNQIKLNFDSREGTTSWADFGVYGDIESYTHSNWNLHIVFNQSYNIGDTFSVTVTYSGLPRGGGLQGFSFDQNVYGNMVISTLSEPYLAQTWWPCKDDPADKIDSVDISVTVPDNMIVASNGILQSVTTNPGNTKTFIWKEMYPITSYLVSLAISNYSTYSDSFQYAPGEFMPIDYYIYPESYNAAQAAFEPLPQMLEVYSNLFGLYPFINEKYGHAEFEWGGAMEHQTCTSIGVVSANYETLYAHELAHQWFGDLVTCHDWHNIWMNEGFATYSEALWMEAAYGKDSFFSYMNSTLTPGNFTGYFPPAIYRYDIDDPYSIFSWTVYVKGMWVLHMLRHVLGDSIFFEIMHDYPNDPTFAFKDVTTEQFRDYCESRSAIDLDDFFQKWIYEEYFPEYEWGYSHYEDGGQNFIYLAIQQKQDVYGYDHLYKMPIDIVVSYSNGNPDTLVIWDSLRVQYYNMPVTGIPESVAFDPQKWILKRANQVPLTSIEPPFDLSNTFYLYQNYPNPFNETTEIFFALDTNGRVQLDVYDINGRKVRRLIDRYMTSGHHTKWDGKDDHNQPVASGIYIYQLKFKNQLLSKKMVLLK